jgi:hypothetical protein
MNVLKPLKQELEFYLNDLFDYVQQLNKVFESLSEKKATQKNLHFLKSFEIKMRTGLELILENKKYFEILEKIRNPKDKMLKENKKRYLDAISEDRGHFDEKQILEIKNKLKTIPLFHATKEKVLLKKSGIFTPASLWNNRIKTSANAMDIALGLHFHYVFFTHGFILENFSSNYVTIDNSALNNAIVSSVDVFKIVLVKNNLENKGIIPTEKWFSALEDYFRQLFSGEDFFEIKTSYILAYFNGDIELYNEFARSNFYSNDLLNAPPGEYPFLGEIKVFGNVSAEQICR